MRFFILTRSKTKCNKANETKIKKDINETKIKKDTKCPKGHF
jgi:hypothetical protein